MRWRHVSRTTFSMRKYDWSARCVQEWVGENNENANRKPDRDLWREYFFGIFNQRVAANKKKRSSTEWRNGIVFMNTEHCVCVMWRFSAVNDRHYRIYRLPFNILFFLFRFFFLRTKIFSKLFYACAGALVDDDNKTIFIYFSFILFFLATMSFTERTIYFYRCSQLVSHQMHNFVAFSSFRHRTSDMEQATERIMQWNNLVPFRVGRWTVIAL